MAAFYLSMKDLKLLFRDKIALFWVFGFPLFFALFIGAIVRAGLSGDSSPIRVALVDDARTDVSRRFGLQLANHPRIQIFAANQAEGYEEVQHARAVAYVHLPRSFGTTSKPEDLPEIGFDPARELELGFLERQVMAALPLPNQGTGAPGQTPMQSAVIELPRTRVAAASTSPQTASDIVFPSAVLWGLIGCAACFAVSLVSERRGGTYLRLQALPLPRHTLLAGKALSTLISCLVVAGLTTAIGAFAFGVQIPSVLRLSLALVSTSVCFMGITMALSVLGRSEQAVAGAGWATLLLMAMLGGGMVPLSFMPAWMVSVSDVSPVKWGILALEGASWRAFSLTEMAVPCGVLVAIGAAAFALGAAVFSRVEA